MASLMEVRDMLALQGRMEAKQLSARLQTPQPLIDAMLERMEAMGKVVRISETSEGCLSGSCKVALKESGVPAGVVGATMKGVRPGRATR